MKRFFILITLLISLKLARASIIDKLISQNQAKINHQLGHLIPKLKKKKISKYLESMGGEFFPTPERHLKAKRRRKKSKSRSKKNHPARKNHRKLTLHKKKNQNPKKTQKKQNIITLVTKKKRRKKHRRSHPRHTFGLPGGLPGAGGGGASITAGSTSITFPAPIEPSKSPITINTTPAYYPQVMHDPSKNKPVLVVPEIIYPRKKKVSAGSIIFSIYYCSET